MKYNKKENKDKKKENFFKDWILPIVLALIFAFLINKFLIFKVSVPTESMVPTINKNEQFMVSKIYNTNNIKRGDIIVFYSNELNMLLIKRVIGLPGDHIVMHDGIVNINGDDLVENYVKNNSKFSETFDVPENKFFFLGDNRSNSDDSRMWIDPYIDKISIKGKALFRCYPFNKIGSLYEN